MAKILVVEDDAVLRSMLEIKLAKDGFDVVVAENGEVGLQKARAETPDLILLDILMPVMDGITMLQRLRAQGWGKTVPVVIFSNLEDVQHVSDLMSLADAYIVKANLELRDLGALVRKHLRTARS